MEYFKIVNFQTLCFVDTRTEYMEIEFEEMNELPKGYSTNDYESKGFVESKLIQDFPLRGRAVFLRLKKRRWRHKVSGKIIKRDFSFIKDAGGYATRYHEQHSQLLRGE
jgi:hypothetical protein